MGKIKFDFYKIVVCTGSRCYNSDVTIISDK